MAHGCRALVAGLVAAALGVVLGVVLGGCPVPPPPGARAGVAPKGGAAQSAKTTTVAEAPDPGPGLEPGSYPFTKESMPSPVRVAAGPVFAGASEGAWSAVLYDAPRLVTLVLTRIDGARFTLGVATKEDGKDAGKPLTLKPTSSEAGKGTTWLVFEGLEVGKAKVDLGVEVPLQGRGAAHSYYLQKSCLSAQVKSGGQSVAVRQVLDGTRRPLGSGTALWLDLNGDGAAAEWELTPGGLVGVAGRLCNLKVTAGDKPALEVSAFDGPTGVVVLNAKDGRGQDTGVWGPVFGGTPRVGYLGVVKTAQVPAGQTPVSYVIPGHGASAGAVTVPGRVSVEAGKAVSLEAGGPVEIRVTANAQSGNVLGTVELKTATGHAVSGGSGESSEGVVEVLDTGGKVLSKSTAEFG